MFDTKEKTVDLRERLMQSLGAGGEALAQRLLDLDGRTKALEAEKAGLFSQITSLESERKEVLRGLALCVDGVGADRAESIRFDIQTLKDRLADLDLQIRFIGPEKDRILIEIAKLKSADYEAALRQFQVDLQDQADAVYQAWLEFVQAHDQFHETRADFERINNDYRDLVRVNQLQSGEFRGPNTTGLSRYAYEFGFRQIETLKVPISKNCPQRQTAVIPHGMIGS